MLAGMLEATQHTCTCMCVCVSLECSGPGPRALLRRADSELQYRHWATRIVSRLVYRQQGADRYKTWSQELDRLITTGQQGSGFNVTTLLQQLF